MRMYKPPKKHFSLVRDLVSTIQQGFFNASIFLDIYKLIMNWANVKR